MLKKYLGIFCLINSLFVSHALANNLPAALYGVDCLSINQNTEAMMEYIEEGTFREALDVDKALLPEFRYELSESFADYLAYASQLVTLKKPLAQLPCPLYTETYKVIAMQHNWSGITKVKHLVSPFELQRPNSKKVILLIHGLTDSPYIFHDLAYFYYQQGFNVRTILLPGHGTSPSDLLDVEYQDWQQATAYAIERSLLDFEQVYLGGFSTGGALIFDYLMTQKLASEKIKGVIMWSPASKAKSDLAWLAGYVDYIPFLDWLDKDADIDFAKYESFPYNAGAQVHALMEKITNNEQVDISYPDIPLLVIASEHDQTIATEATLDLLNRWHRAKGAEHQTETSLLYFGDINHAKAKLDSSINVFSPECKQGWCLRVHNIAHTATTNAPVNPHYGVNSQYHNCGHYLAELEKYLACKTSRVVEVGELTEENLAKFPLMQRLTYNPYYDDMLRQLKSFLARSNK